MWLCDLSALDFATTIASAEAAALLVRQRMRWGVTEGCMQMDGSTWSEASMVAARNMVQQCSAGPRPVSSSSDILEDAINYGIPGLLPAASSVSIPVACCLLGEYPCCLLPHRC